MKNVRSLLLVGAVAMSLAACGTTSNIDGTISQVQATTKQICKYLPTVETVAKILSSSAVVETASSIASSICNAVTSVPLADGGSRNIYVKGVLVKGRFVK